MDPNPQRFRLTEKSTLDIQLDCLTNAVAAAFLGCLSQRMDLSTSTKYMEYTIHGYVTGPNPPFKGWAITSIFMKPELGFELWILTHNDEEHKIRFQTQGAYEQCNDESS